MQTALYNKLQISIGFLPRVAGISISLVGLLFMFSVVRLF